MSLAVKVSSLTVNAPHTHPHSIRQRGLQPSPPTVFPSSHSLRVPRGMMPEPHTSSPNGISHKSDGPPALPNGSAPQHTYPGSTEHSALQPSPETELPSSHHSKPVLSPSPHVGVHVPEVHSHPSSGVQKALHPSLERVFPSSHCSQPLINPSPHVGSHTLSESQNLEHVHASSIVHELEHPSPSLSFPSSHPSQNTEIMPSPHTGTHCWSPFTSAEQLNPASTVH
jgi:hypothetical protein